MPTFNIKEVGPSPGKTRVVEAHNDIMAVAEVAGCDWRDVGGPIWCEGSRFPVPAGLHPYARRCYMPMDSTGRQWLVEDVQEGAWA